MHLHLHSDPNMYIYLNRKVNINNEHTAFAPFTPLQTTQSLSLSLSGRLFKCRAQEYFMEIFSIWFFTATCIQIWNSNSFDLENCVQIWSFNWSLATSWINELNSLIQFNWTETNTFYLAWKYHYFNTLNAATPQNNIYSHTMSASARTIAQKSV